MYIVIQANSKYIIIIQEVEVANITSMYDATTITILLLCMLSII